MSKVYRGRRLLAVGTAVVATAAAAGGAVAVAAPSGTSTLYLNSHGSAASDVSRAQCVAEGGCGPTVAAPSALISGQTYTIQVSGTVSAWDAWGYKRCGKPQPSPEYKSPGVASTPTEDDAQFRFAWTSQGGACPKPLPQKSGLFQMNLGNGWFHPVAVNDPSRPSRDRNGLQHPYIFQVTGTGATPQFRFVDYHPSDNDGEFKIVISASTQVAPEGRR